MCWLRICCGFLWIMEVVVLTSAYSVKISQQLASCRQNKPDYCQNFASVSSGYFWNWSRLLNFGCCRWPGLYSSACAPSRGPVWACNGFGSRAAQSLTSQPAIIMAPRAFAGCVLSVSFCFILQFGYDSLHFRRIRPCTRAPAMALVWYATVRARCGYLAGPRT